MARPMQALVGGMGGIGSEEDGVAICLGIGHMVRGDAAAAGARLRFDHDGLLEEGDISSVTYGVMASTMPTPHETAHWVPARQRLPQPPEIRLILQVHHQVQDSFGIDKPL